MNKLSSIFLMSVKTAPISSLTLLMSLNGFGSNIGEVLFLFLIVSIVSGIIALVMGSIVFSIIANYYRVQKDDTAVGIFIKHLPWFVFPFGLWAISMFIYSSDSSSDLLAVSLTAYVSAVAAWYFFATDFYRNQNNYE